MCSAAQDTRRWEERSLLLLEHNRDWHAVVRRRRYGGFSAMNSAWAADFIWSREARSAVANGARATWRDASADPRMRRGNWKAMLNRVENRQPATYGDPSAEASR